VNVKYELKRGPWRRHTAAAALWICTQVTSAVNVGARDAENSDWELPNTSCEPECRSGYECRRGECMPVCSPACGAGLLCSAEGRCVSAEPVVPAKPVRRTRTLEPANSCEPECRSGFVCREARCVSRCNPLCPADEVCTPDGECVAARFADASVSSEPVSSSANSRVNLHADVAGLLQFGVTPTLEVGEHWSGYVRARLVNTGLASHFLLGQDSSDELRIGAGAALGMHWFTARHGSMRDLYGGVAVEYVFVEMKDTSVDFARYRMHTLIPQVDLGYRWAFGSLLVGVSGKLGFAVPLRSHAVGVGDLPCRRPDSCDPDVSASFIPGIGVDIGWFIPR
jgi:hypothetical protein